MGAGHGPSAIDVSSEAASRLVSVDQRFTPNRRSLVDILSRADRPLTMPELLDRGDGLAQSSVYRNLVVLEEAGVVRRIVTNDEFARYELAEDLTGHHHHHLVCTACGSVEDVTVPGEIEAVLDDGLERLAAANGFTVDGHQLDLLGRCRDCS
ncbi:MAG: transcriptional repressor [Acidimicrobiales bacterium]